MLVDTVYSLQIITIILTFTLVLKNWKYKRLRLFSMTLFIIFICIDIPYIYLGFGLSLVSFFILRNKYRYLKNRSQLLKYFSK
jgi:hypothetical protein